MFLLIVALTSFARNDVHFLHSLPGLAPFSHRNPPARVKRRCAFRLRVRLQPLLASTRPWSLFTDIGVFSCQLFYRDAIFFSSPQLAKKRRQIRFLDYSALCAPVIRSKILRIFSLISELEMLRVSGVALTLPKIRVLDFLIARCCRGLRYAVVHFALAPRVSLRSPVRKSATLRRSRR